MRTKLYALFDKKASQYGGVLIGQADGHMARIVEERFRGSNDTVERFPQDFDLYQLGEYDMDSGHILPEVRFVSNVGVFLQTKEG